MENSNLNQKVGCFKIFSLYIKTSETICYKRNREKECYEINKEALTEKARNKYRELSDEEKNIKRGYESNRYHHNMSEVLIKH